MRSMHGRFASLLLSGLLVFGQAAPGFAQARPPAAIVAEWPHTMSGAQGSVTVYQPQAIGWADHATLTARAAVAITPTGAKTPILGTLDLSVSTTVDPAAKLVQLSEPKLTASHFPSLDTTQAAQMEQKIRDALPGLHLKSVPLDAVLMSLKRTQDVQPVIVNNDPPTIFYSGKPASLVVFDGEPVLTPIGESGLSYAVNTNWPVFTDGTLWYLLNGAMWLSAPASSGPYKPVGSLPPVFNAIPNDQNFADVRKALPAKPQQGPVPDIYVSTKPAEIIVTDGPPKFVPVAGTGLQQVTNASSDLFFDPTKGQFYFLTSGRWFSASALNGPWVFATQNLPPDFAFIDPQGPQAHVLASVPNTAQAQAAVLQAQIPQQGTLKRSEAKLTVAYAGQPQFEPIPGTSLRYAVNTSNQVLEVGGKYYACYQGAWFVAASPTGPWALAETVPQAIYTIPSSSPLYPVTYVTVQSYDPASVTYAYTAGYMLGFVTAGVLAYGTGFYYPPYIYPGRVPGYFPYPYTYAGRVWYNPANGAWARGATVYGPYGTAKGGAYYNPSNGAWARGGAVYGPNGGAGAWSAYNPSTGSYARGAASWNAYGGTATASAYNAQTGRGMTTTQNTNMYQRWGSSTYTSPTRTVNTASASGARGSVGGFSSSTGAEGAGYNTARGQGGVVKTPSGDVYAGRDGNAYQHSASGWSTWNNGAWQPVQRPTGAANGAEPRTPPASRPPAPQTPERSQYQNFDRGQYQTMDRSNYQQLEQDRQARWSGDRFGGFGGAARPAFEGGRFRR